VLSKLAGARLTPNLTRKEGTKEHVKWRAGEGRCTVHRAATTRQLVGVLNGAFPSQGQRRTAQSRSQLDRAPDLALRTEPGQQHFDIRR
jgi:hypothetical protein